MEKEKEYGQIEYANKGYKVLVDFTELQPGYKNSEGYTACYEGISVLIVNNGTLRVSDGKRGINIEAGQGIVINSNVDHKLLLASNDSCGFYRVAFSLDFIFPEKYLQEKYASKFIYDSEMALIKLTEDNLRGEALLDGFNRIIAANLVKKSGYEVITRGILCNIWMLFEEYQNDSGRGSGNARFSPDEERVKAACDFISKHYADTITLSDIAEHIHLSDSECCRCFKRVLFISPIEYLMEYRIYSAARILLKNPRAVSSMSDLSFDTGFNAPSYFNRVFKRYMQCSPTEFRKLTQSDPDRAERLFISIQEGVTIL